MKQHSASIFSNEPELASDLEWMLQSGQAPPNMLAAELARAYFKDLQRWLVLLLDDPEQADYLSLKAIMDAAQSAYRFPGGISSRVWVFLRAASLARRALRTWRWQRKWGGILGTGEQNAACSLPATYQDAAIWIAVDRLSDEARLAVGLAWGIQLETAAIASILELPELEIERMLDQATRQCLGSLAAFDLKLDDLPEQALDLTIRESLARRAGQLQSEPLDMETLARNIAAEMQHQVGCQSIFTRLKEFTWLGLVAVLILGIFWMVNGLLPEETPDPAIQQNQPVSQPTLPYTPPAGVVLMDYFAHPGETVDEIGKRLQLPPAEITRLRSLYSDSNLDVVRPVQIELIAPKNLPTPTPLAPAPPQQDALTVNSSPLDIRNRMNDSRSMWQSLWMDSLYFNYGLNGFSRITSITRVQAWLNQPDSSLVITWNSNEDNTLTELKKDALVYTVSPNGKFYALHADTPGLRSNPYVLEMIASGRSQLFSQPGQVQILGEDVVAGRPTVLVYWHTDARGIWPNQYRIWVDSQTGIVMRYQFFASPVSDTLLGDVMITRLDLDVNFSQPDLFTPWRLPDRVFVSDYTGSQIDASVLPNLTPTPDQVGPAHTPPPPGFNLAASKLEFEYMLDLQLGIKLSRVAVSAGPYYLGELQLADPWSVYCFRSPDGRKVAYSFNPYGGPLIGSGWFELASPFVVKTGTFQQRYGIFAFAPDSRQLAFFGRAPYTSPSPFILIDTSTGQESLLAYFHNVASMFWKPDGSQIAILVAPDDWWSKMDAVILDAAEGNELYRIEVDPTGFWDPASRTPDWPAPDWPARDWGATFPQIQQGLANCASPP